MQLLSTYTAILCISLRSICNLLSHAANFHRQLSYVRDQYLSTITLRLQLFCMHSLCASVDHVAEVVTVQFAMGPK